MRLYHYTTGAHMARIMADGFLKLTPSPERLFPRERPLVWLTTDNDMPPTALKPMRLGESVHYPTADELCMYAGIYRFTMPSGLRVAKWAKIRDHFGADPALADVAERMGEDPKTWRATVKRIKVKGLVCEVRQTGGDYCTLDPSSEVLWPDVSVEKY